MQNKRNSCIETLAQVLSDNFINLIAFIVGTYFLKIEPNPLGILWVFAQVLNFTKSYLIRRIFNKYE